MRTEHAARGRVARLLERRRVAWRECGARDEAERVTRARRNDDIVRPAGQPARAPEVACDSLPEGGESGGRAILRRWWDRDSVPPYATPRVRRQRGERWYPGAEVDVMVGRRRVGDGWLVLHAEPARRVGRRRQDRARERGQRHLHIRARSVRAREISVGDEVGIGRDRDVARDRESGGEPPRRGEARAGGELPRADGVPYLRDDLPVQRTI